MTSTSSLTGTCTVCYAEEPKYRCPRCKSQTCSLPCYKRHQQRASCTGVRDPATFIKKSEWATAAGIDHDYNYLKSIERNIERADSHVQPRTSDEAGSVRRNREQWRPDSALQRYLSDHSITIQRAPEGMSRSRLNKTRHTQKGKVFWTVEFVDGSGRVSTEDDCLTSSKLVDLWQTSVSKRRKADGRTAGSDNSPSKRRKTEIHVDSSAQTATPEADLPERTIDTAVSLSATSVNGEATMHFYFKRSDVASTKSVLVPVDAQQCLVDILRFRTLQEYPTFYVLQYAANELPDHFILESKDAPSVTASSSQTQSSSRIQDHSHPPSVTEKPLQTEKLLEMLRRDLT